MKRLFRAVVTAVSAVVVAVVSAAGVSAAGLITPGHLSSDFADGNAFWYSTAYAQVSVNRNTFVFHPSHNGGPATMQHATLLFVTLQSSTFFGSDCFIIPDADFVEGAGLQSATLNAYVDSTNLCYAYATPAGDVVTAAGGGKGGPPPDSGIPLPMSLSITWAGNGVETSATQSGHSMCATFNSVMQNSSKVVYGAASGTVSFYDGTPAITLPGSDFANVDQGTFQSDNQGTVDPRCFGGV